MTNRALLTLFLFCGLVAVTQAGCGGGAKQTNTTTTTTSTTGNSSESQPSK